MSAAEIISEFTKLPLAERLEVVHALWDTILDEDSDQIPVSEAQRALLHERLEYANQNPEEGRPWRDVVEELEESL